MAIANAVQRGSTVFVYDERNRQIFTIPAGTGPAMGSRAIPAPASTFAARTPSSPTTIAAGRFRPPLPADMAALHWLGLRPGHYVSGEPNLCGISTVATGLDEDGAAWLARLTGSAWFAGLGLRADDLLAGGAKSAAGTWDTAGADLPPGAPLIALAIDNPALADDTAVTNAVHTLGLLGRVMVTMPISDAAADLASSLQKAGAFVVTGEPGIPLGHLHHFPLRMAINPSHGQLVGIDLADALAVCRPGETATLLCCASLAEAEAAITLEPANALIAHWHVAPADWDLRRFDRILGTEARPQVYTTADRLDGVTGTLDLLLPTGT